MAYAAGRWPAGTYWTVVLVTLAVVLGTLVVALLPWTHTPSGAVATLVPADGTRLAAGAGGDPAPTEPDSSPQEQAWWENAVVPAELGGKGMPRVAADLLTRAAPDTGGVFRDWSWWRSTLHTPDSTEPGRTDPEPWRTRLFRVGDETVDWVMTYDTAGGEVFQPAVTVVPTDADAPDEWEQEGTLTRSGNGPETADYRARVRWESADDPGIADRNCRVATVSLTVAAEEREPRRLVFCPGQGIIADLAADDQVSQPPTARRVPSQEPAPPASAWNTEQWELRRDLPQSLPWSGEDDEQPAAADEEVTGGLVRPVQTAGGVLVASNTDAALFAMTGPPGQRRLAWVVTPGDRILSLQAIGRILVVTTGDRRIVGYDERGRWLWEVRRPDVVQNRALPVTETTFAVAGVDGAVELRELATGALVWRADLGSAINAVSTDPEAQTVHVIDDTGVVTEFGADSSTPRWQQEVAAGPAQLESSAGGTTVLLPNALHRLRAGEEVWRTSLAFANRIDVDQQHAYVVADRRLRAYDLTSGTVRWSRAGVRTTAVPQATPGPQTTPGPAETGSSVAVLAADGAVLTALTADGEVVAEVDVELHNQWRLVPLADGVLVHWAPDPKLVSWEHDG